MSNFEGQIIVTVQNQGPQQDFDAASISSSVKELLSKAGELMAYADGPAMAPIASFRAEYYNSECVNAAVAKLDGLVIGVSHHPFSVACILLTHSVLYAESDSLRA